MTKAPEAAAEKGGKTVVLDADTLKAEVRAFASSLGFPALGAAGAFDYDDFAPQKAAQKISAAPDQPKRQQQQRQRDGSTDAAARQQGRKGGQEQQQQQKDRHQQQQQKGGKHSEQHQQQQHDARGGRQQQQQPQQQQQNKLTKQEQEAAAKEEAVRTRTWVDSVGPRPGEARGRSLLGKDEPSLWYEAAAAAAGLPQPGSSSSKPPLGEDASEVLRSKAEALLEREGQLFEREVQGRNAADARWLSQVRRSGTTADKVAAMSLMVGSSAAGGLKSLDGLMGLMGKSGGGKQVVLAAMEALQELFLSSLLPDRKLRVLEAQPLQALPPGKEGERCLLLWGVEDAVKRRYQQFVQLLEKCSTDNLDFVKERATKTIFKLLAAKPEGEQALLSALVNKLGDPSRKLASDAAFLLGQLLLQHPAMKAVVVREVERFLFRPGLSDRGRYYAVTFLNQIPMSNRPQEGGSVLALKLVDVYFSLFKLLLEGRLGTAAARRQQQEAAAAAAGGKHRHSKKKGGKHGAQQQQQQKHQQQRHQRKGDSGSSGNGGSSEAAAAAAAAECVEQAGELDARMLSALITGVRRAFPYVEPDKVEPLVEAHGEALFKLVHTAPFTVALQALMLMYQLLAGRNAVSERYYRALYAVLLTEGATGAAGVRGPQFLSLLVKSMKGDASIKRVAAFAKRLLQVSCHAPAPWAAGGLLLLSEVLKAHPGLWAAVQQPEDAAAAAEVFRDAPEDSTAAAAAGGSDSDDEEVFRDVEDSEDEGAAAAMAVAGSKQKQQGKQKQGKQKQGKQAVANGSAAEAAGGRKQQQQQQQWPKEGCYDMRKREPLYANAEGSCWWELMLLAKHSHPSVAAFARSLLAGVPVVYTGDPLRDLGTTAFLDKFVNKKPKAAPKGTSLMQPSHSLTAAAAAAGSSPAAAMAAAAGSSAAADVTTLGPNAFADLVEADVAPDQLFFHKFFNLSAVKSKSQTAAAARAAKAAAAAAKAAAGDGSGSDEDGDMDGGELGTQGIESDEDFESEEVDRALAEAEGVEDDGLGDPDVGYDYDALLAAMAADGGSSDGGSSDGGSSDGGSSDGGGSEEGEEPASGSGDDSSSDGGSSGEEEEGESEEGEWVMLEGAAAAAAAAVNSSSKAGKGEKKKKRKLDAGAGGEEGSDDDVNPFDLASPSSSSDGDGEQQQQKGSRKKQRQQQQQQEEEEQEGGAGGGGEGESDLDLDMDDIMGGSDDNMSEEEGDMMLTAGEEEVGGSSSEDEAAPAAGSGGGGQQKGGKQKGRQKGAGLFADASAYDDYFARFDKAAATAEDGDGGGAAADGDAAAERRGKRSRGAKKAGGGKKHRAT